PAHAHPARHHARVHAHPVQGGGAVSAAVVDTPTAAPAGQTLRARPRRPGVAAAKTVGLAALLAFSLFPAYWMFSSAIDPQAATRGGRRRPAGVTGDNSVRAIDVGGVGRDRRSAGLVALGTVRASSGVALPAAVAVSRFRFRFRKSMLVLILMVQMVPREALV